MNLVSRNRLRDIIDEYTKYNVVVISHEIVTEFKSLLRGDDRMIEFCFEHLFEKLANNHPQTRLLALMLINVIFIRSKHFRQLTVNNLDIFFELTLPINPQKPLPSPCKTALYLTQQSIEFIEEWVQDFGAFYFRLKLGYDHLLKVHHIHFPNKRLQEKEQQKLKQINDIKRLKAKLQRFIELISKFKEKYPKIIEFLNEFEKKIQKITPSFDSMLQTLTQKKQTQFIGFSDDETDDETDDHHDDDSDIDLNLELPSNINININNNNNNDNNYNVDNDEIDDEFLNGYKRYGFHKGYSLKITIDTNLDNYLNKQSNDDKNDKQKLIKQISQFRYLTETKLNNQIEEWRSILINADLNVITNKEKQLIFANHRIQILRKLDDIQSKSTSFISQCNILKIDGKQNKKYKKKKKKKERENKVIATKYIDVKASVAFANDENQEWKQREIKRRMLTRNKQPSQSKQQRKRILFKKLLPKQKKTTGVRFGAVFPDK